MNKVTVEQLREKFSDKGLNICPIDTDDLIFEERVRMSCFYCARYGQNWKCPPNLPDLDYKKIFAEFDNAAFVWVEYPIDKDNYDDLRTESTNYLHLTLLSMEYFLLEKGCPIYLSFIGGSCKLCKNGCGKDRCNNPYKSRSPLEATGVNIVESAKKYGIHIGFPVTDKLMRLGLLLW